MGVQLQHKNLLYLTYFDYEKNSEDIDQIWHCCGLR